LKTCEVEEIVLDKGPTRILCNAWVLGSDMRACSGVWLNPSFLLSSRGFSSAVSFRKKEKKFARESLRMEGSAGCSLLL